MLLNRKDEELIPKLSRLQLERAVTAALLHQVLGKLNAPLDGFCELQEFFFFLKNIYLHIYTYLIHIYLCIFGCVRS